jgi:flagellar hook assembly protein FlgD
VAAVPVMPLPAPPSATRNGGVAASIEKEENPGLGRGVAHADDQLPGDGDSRRTIKTKTTHLRLRRHALHALALAGVVCACLAAFAALAPQPSRAASGGAPQVRLKTLHLAGDRLALTAAGGRTAAAVQTLDAGMRFSMAGLICDVPAVGGVTVSLRTSADGAAWSRWLDAPLEVVDEGGHAQACTDPLWTGTGRYLQVRARDAAGDATTLSGVRIVAIDPGAGETDVRATGVAGRAAEPAARSATTEADPPALVTRAEWGADESMRGDAPAYAPVKMAFVHHTAGGNTYTRAEAPGLMRGIYAYHTKSLHWSDIGYNFLIDRFGTIYEGRYGGITRGVIGAQVGGFNTGSTGISVIGTFTEVAPPQVALTALERLLAWKLSLGDLDPKGTAELTCGLTDKYKKGDAVTFPVIAGHRDANYTECPGDQLYALLPAIRADVAERLSPTPVVATLTADRTLVSPNGDGTADQTDLAGSLSISADWRLVIKDAGGHNVGSWSGHGDKASVTWKGTAGSSVVPDGDYTAELTASTAAGTSDTASVKLTVDTSAPRLLSAKATPASFSPNGDAQEETATVTYSPAEACSVRVGVLDASGKLLRWLRGWRKEDAAAQSVTWDGRVSSHGSLVTAPSGRYRFSIERRDAAGNVARNGVKIVLDRSLGFPTARPAAFSPNGDAVKDDTSLGFKLTRKAKVTVKIAVGKKVVRTLSPGSLGAGPHTVNWDGRTRKGAFVASGRPVVTIEAVTPLGRTSVTEDVLVDLVAPRLYATSGTKATVGTVVHLSCKAVDPFSEKIDLSFEVTNAKGKRVASGRPGLTVAGQDVSVNWKPSAKGSFIVTWHGTDGAGNHEVKPATTVVAVR